jgi:hypothetical protein
MKERVWKGLGTEVRLLMPFCLGLFSCYLVAQAIVPGKPHPNIIQLTGQVSVLVHIAPSSLQLLLLLLAPVQGQ